MPQGADLLRHPVSEDRLLAQKTAITSWDEFAAANSIQASQSRVHGLPRPLPPVHRTALRVHGLPRPCRQCIERLYCFSPAQGWDEFSDPCSGWTGINCAAGSVISL